MQVFLIISFLFFTFFFGFDLFRSALLLCKYTKLCNIVQVFVILFLLFIIYF